MLRGARRVRPKGKYVFVWINTHHQIRLYDARAETDGSVSRGRYMIGGRNQIYLSTTGFNPYRKTLGTPHVLEVNVHVEPAPGAPLTHPDLRALANQVLSLTKLNWASTDSLCAEPITTKYAGDIAYLTAAFLRQDAAPFTFIRCLNVRLGLFDDVNAVPSSTGPELSDRLSYLNSPE